MIVVTARGVDCITGEATDASRPPRKGRIKAEKEFFAAQDHVK